jgi:hypothetical protein
MLTRCIFISCVCVFVDARTVDGQRTLLFTSYCISPDMISSRLDSCDCSTCTPFSFIPTSPDLSSHPAPPFLIRASKHGLSRMPRVGTSLPLPTS